MFDLLDYSRIDICENRPESFSALFQKHRTLKRTQHLRKFALAYASALIGRIRAV